MARIMDKARQNWMHVEAAVSRLDGPKKYEEWDRTRIRMRDLGDKVLNYCPPDGSKLGQAVDILCKSIRENTADRHKTAAHLAREALKAVWPELNGPPELGRAATVRQAEAKVEMLKGGTA